MRDFVTDGSFELNSPLWQWEDGAYRSDRLAFDGQWSARFDTINDEFLGIPILQGGLVRQEVVYAAGACYRFGVWTYGSEAIGGDDFQVFVDPGDGQLREVWRVPASPSPGWARREICFVAVGERGEIAMGAGPPDSVGTVAIWYADLVSGIPMAITQNIQDAILTDLRTIPGLTGAYPEPPGQYPEITAPAAYMLGSAYEADSADLDVGARTGFPVQRYEVALLIKSATPNADANELFDQARNALERTDSVTKGVAGVHWVNVAEAGPQELTDETTHQGVYQKNIEVAVRYQYQRGAA